MNAHTEIPFTLTPLFLVLVALELTSIFLLHYCAAQDPEEDNAIAPLFPDAAKVCLNASSGNANKRSAASSSLCVELCKLDCLTFFAQGKIWLPCLLQGCPGDILTDRPPPSLDHAIVTSGTITVPLDRDSSMPSSKNSMTSSTDAMMSSTADDSPRHTNIQTSANSSFLIDVKSLLLSLGGEYSPRQFIADVTVHQVYGSVECYRKRPAVVRFSIQTDHGHRSILVRSGETKPLDLQLTLPVRTLLLSTTIVNSGKATGDVCVSALWIKPRLIPRATRRQNRILPPCKEYCRSELYRSGRAPLSCFMDGCNGSRVRLDKRTAQKQPYIVFPCHARPVSVGIDTSVLRRTKNITFFHSRAARQQTPGLGMKGNAEVTFDLARIRANLARQSPGKPFDMLSANVGLVPVHKSGCLWTSKGRLYHVNSSGGSNRPQHLSVQARFSVFADGVFVEAISVSELLSKEIVALLRSSARHLTLRVAYNDSLSKRCTRPAWADIELQHTSQLSLLDCQARCAAKIESGIAPLSCFTGTCPGRVTRTSFRPFFWVEQAAYGVGVDTTEGKPSFRLGGQGQYLKWGLGAQPTSSIMFDLHALRRHNITFNTFSSYVGIDTRTVCSYHRGQANFRVYLDNKLVYGRRLLHEVEMFHLSVRGARWLKLVTKYSDALDIEGVCAHAVWGSARLWNLLG